MTHNEISAALTMYAATLDEYNLKNHFEKLAKDIRALGREYDELKDPKDVSEDGKGLPFGEIKYVACGENKGMAFGEAKNEIIFKVVNSDDDCFSVGSYYRVGTTEIYTDISVDKTISWIDELEFTKISN